MREGAVIETHEVAPWIERLARVGYVAKAFLYGRIGALAALAAFGSGGRTTDTRRAALKAFQAAGKTLKDLFKFLVHNFSERSRSTRSSTLGKRDWDFTLRC
jgi:hypothetical protein